MVIRVYVVEDHPLMRASLLEYLGLHPDIEVCGVAASTEEALDDLVECDPTVVLVDLALPGRSGLDLLAEVHDRWALPCVVLSGHGEGNHVRKALAAGAVGYVLKGRPGEVPTAIRRAAAGQGYLSATLG